MNTRKKQNFLDGLARKDNRIRDLDLPLANFVIKHKKSSTFFSKHGRTGSFFTADSKLYLTSEELKMHRRRERIIRIIKRLDSLNAQSFEKTKIYRTSVAQKETSFVNNYYQKFREAALELVEFQILGIKQKITLVRMWNLSIVGAVIFGMFMMTTIYRYLGQGVSAKIQENQTQAQEKIEQLEEQLAREETETMIQEINDSIDMESITSLLSEENSKKDLEKEIMEMVKGYPIESMVPLIAKQDRVVAAFIVGIARQESTWGLHVPAYKDQDCHNLWGWRGKNAVGTGGHTCFDSPEDAVNTVAKRIKFLVSNQKLNTPEKMIIWKCGDCSWDNQRDMQRWISSVSTYFHKLNGNKQR